MKGAGMCIRRIAHARIGHCMLSYAADRSYATA